MDNMDLKVLAEQLGKTNELLMAMVNKEGNIEKAPAANANNAPLHGPNGLWSGQGLDQNVLSAMITPSGLAEKLPVYPSVYTDPRFASFTGVTDADGAEAATPCADGPTAYAKGCELTAQFGRKIVSSHTIDLKEVGLKLNRGDMTDLRLINPVVFSSLAPKGVDTTNILNVVTAGEMFNMATLMERWMSSTLWTGSPANNNAGKGYMEFPGLDNQIATGQVDANTGTACPALDSDVKDFNYNDVEGVNLDIVEYMSEMEHYLTAADRGQHLRVNRAWVMREDLFFALAAVWPCRYLTNRCQNSAGTNIAVVNDNVNSQMRWEIYKSKMLPVNGTMYPVIIDDGIYEHNSTNNANLAAGSYASTIYFIPFTANNIPITYMEHVDYTKSNLDIALLNGKESFWHTDNGRYFWTIEQTKTCVTLSLTQEPRVVLRAPQLAGKIQRVAYSPMQHTKDWNPDSSYHLDGGVSAKSYTQPHAVWSSR